MKTIETIMAEINHVMALVDEKQLEDALPLFQKTNVSLLLAQVEVAFKQKDLLCV